MKIATLVTLAISLLTAKTFAQRFENDITIGKGLTVSQSTVYAVELVTYAASVTLDLNPSFHANVRVLTLAGNLTVAVSSAGTGRWFTFIITGDGSTRNLTLPAWKFMNASAPTTLAAGKTATLTVFYVDATDGNAVANYSVQP